MGADESKRLEELIRKARRLFQRCSPSMSARAKPVLAIARLAGE
jgi:hypothetical protein